MKAYSLSTPEGDSLLDYEDDAALFAAVYEGSGNVTLAQNVYAAVNDDDPRYLDVMRQQLLSNYGVTLTVHNDEDDEGE